MTVVLTPQEMEALRSIDSPTMANAIEPLKLRHRAEGFMGPDIRCYYPEMGVMVGYAVTAKINTVYGDRPLSRNNWFEFLEAMQSVPEPRVLVMEDESVPSGRACFHGEIICSAHNRLGIIGLVTNGAVRDLDQVRELGFHYFAAGLVASHGKLEVSSWMTPVRVGGVTIKPGDLVHGDQHGVLHIPDEAAKEAPAQARRITDIEAGYLEVINGPDFSIAKLQAKMEAK